MKNRLLASYTVAKITEEYIYILDNCLEAYTMSVTNNAEGVVEHLLANFPIQNKTIYYRDTEGRVDILKHDNKEFIDFEFGYDTEEEFLSKK